jgi:hypothetical protein
MSRAARHLTVWVVSLGLLVGPATMASAAATGTCSVIVPSRVSVVSLRTEIRATLAKDCVANRVWTTEWNLRHQYWGKREGVYDVAYFGEGVRSTTMSFFDTHRLGTYDLRPYNSMSLEGTGLRQNTPTVVIRLGSRLALTSSRSGNTMTLNATATRYSPWVEHFVAWQGKKVALQYRTSAGSWKTFKTVKTSSRGSVTYRFGVLAKRSYRAVTADQTSSWGRTSNTVAR